MTADLRNLVVEVLHNRGDDNHPDWSVGSGFFVGTKLVLTALHNVDGSGEVLVRVHGTEEHPAVVRLQGDEDEVDLAVLEVSDVVVDVPPLRYGEVDRRVAKVVKECWAVGFPMFKERAHDPKPRRLSAQVDGEIPTGENLDQPLLTLQVRRSPRPLSGSAVRESEWAGMSGAAVFAGNNIIVGVITEHHLPEGESALTVVPITALDLLPEAEATKGWKLLGVNHQALVRLPGKEPSSLSRVEKQNRTRLMKRVRATWIEEVLEHSLYQAALIALNLQEQPDALANPWHLEVQETNLPPQPLPAGTSILQVYDKAEGELLILGEPGAGKTTLLLHLASDLLKRAEQESIFPMPVVFTLSSWAEKRLPLPDWLVEELFTKYQVPRNLGRSWVENDQLLLLLDGLDEVTQVHRSACIQAINAYRQEHNLVHVVLCSRKAEYEAQSTRLGLSKAVVIQPLTSQQIDEYLTQAGQQLEAVRSLLREDQELQELARTPLMLNILARTYQGKAVDDLVTHMPPDVQRHHVFGTYVERILQRGKVLRYTPQKTMHWLAWLAEQMKHRHQPIFYIEQMQPYLLPERQSLFSQPLSFYYELLAIRLPDILIGICVTIGIFALFFSEVQSKLLIYGFFGGLIGSLIGRKQMERNYTVNHIHPRGDSWRRLVNPRYLRIGLLFGLSFGLISAWSYGAVFGLPYGIAYGLMAYTLSFLLENMQEARPPASMASWSVTNLWYKLTEFGYLRIGLSCGVCFGLGYIISTETAHELHSNHGHVVAYALAWIFNYTLIGILLCIIFERRKREVQLAEIINWSWTKFFHQLIAIRHISNSILIGLFTGLVIAISGWLLKDITYGLDLGLSTGLTFALSYWILLSLFIGLSSDILEDRVRKFPNQGIRRSIVNSLRVGFISGLISGVICASSFIASHWVVFGIAGLSYGLTVGFVVALVFGICIGMVVGLLSGGYASIQHYILRLLLCISGVIPRNYAQFLNYAYERILLQKIGGGYAFIHHLLLDYFASQIPSQLD